MCMKIRQTCSLTVMRTAAVTRTNLAGPCYISSLGHVNNIAMHIHGTVKSADVRHEELGPGRGPMGL